VSVLIPAYGVTQYIAETLDSVLVQSYRDFEIIVVNDGCPGSAALEAALRPYRERIVYIRTENGGVSCARNVGVRAARAPSVALLDGDDAWLSDCSPPRPATGAPIRTPTSSTATARYSAIRRLRIAP
jgi:glycosyltransferase involved in cell wall biosynthesis